VQTNCSAQNGDEFLHARKSALELNHPGPMNVNCKCGTESANSGWFQRVLLDNVLLVTQHQNVPGKSPAGQSISAAETTTRKPYRALKTRSTIGK
jgi:hypothetical protein